MFQVLVLGLFGFHILEILRWLNSPWGSGQNIKFTTACHAGSMVARHRQHVEVHMLWYTQVFKTTQDWKQQSLKVRNDSTVTGAAAAEVMTLYANRNKWHGLQPPACKAISQYIICNGTKTPGAIEKVIWLDDQSSFTPLPKFRWVEAQPTMSVVMC